MYFSDPDGYGIELYAVRNYSEWNWRDGEVEMTVDPLDFSNLLAEAGEGQWSRLPFDTVMVHIHLHVSNLVEAEHFYREGLDFDVVCRYGDQALFMASGGYHHDIGLNTWAGVVAPRPKEKQVGLKHFPFNFRMKLQEIKCWNSYGNGSFRQSRGRVLPNKRSIWQSY